MIERIGEERGKLFGLRQILNVLFILSAIAGMIVWFQVSKQVGTYLLIGACVLKFAEVTLRIIKI